MDVTEPSVSPVAFQPAGASDILATPEVRRQLLRMSVADYQRLGAAGIVGARTELIRGMVLDKTSKPPLHAWLAQYLTDWLKASTGEGWAVRT